MSSRNRKIGKLGIKVTRKAVKNSLPVFMGRLINFTSEKLKKGKFATKSCQLVKTMSQNHDFPVVWTFLRPLRLKSSFKWLQYCLQPRNFSLLDISLPQNSPTSLLLLPVHQFLIKIAKTDSNLQPQNCPKTF